MQNISPLPSNYNLANRIKKLNKEVDRALDEGKFIWTYPGLENLREYFSLLLS
jgi:chromosome partitioning protein